ncbi:hypothetical protein AMS68_006795 [Peltaster fructicola]|uniref:Uncharacterized protein n=1 Tax=Peltaster fructicola TaxID=286661 RepID=A0A6H0Y353_9PEZI|nr:hypothetical protein AMS68_006795 [Peltaster fructicola]
MARPPRSPRTGATPARKKTWQNMLIAAITLSVVFTWVWSALLEAILMGCPVYPTAYCRQWRPLMVLLFWIFTGFMGASLLFLITTLILRCTPWYKGSRVYVKDIEESPEEVETIVVDTTINENKYSNDVAKR